MYEVDDLRDDSWVSDGLDEPRVGRGLIKCWYLMHKSMKLLIDGLISRDSRKQLWTIIVAGSKIEH